MTLTQQTEIFRRVFIRAVLLLSVAAICNANLPRVYDSSPSSHATGSINDVLEAIELLQFVGLYVCDPNDDGDYKQVQSCSSHGITRQPPSTEQRHLQDVVEAPIWINLVAVVCCVCLAALAAGLTLGLLGIDPLMLLIKERAGETEEERKRASALLPIVKQHHRLLVTLLLMNALANEALPIFLDALVPTSIAIILSVTLVLFFGEIIPAAIFTGPNQLRIAHRLVPVVNTAMLLLYPLAGPIAALLDYLLHDEGDVAAYNRGELSALIRIQYEERLAIKRKRRANVQKAALLTGGDHVGTLDFTSPLNEKNIGLHNNKILRAAKSQLEHSKRTFVHDSLMTLSAGNRTPTTSTERPTFERSTSLHADEIMMVEGALQMKTKVALDVYTPIQKVFTVPSDMELTESNLVKIYVSGFTRVPVHAPGDGLAIQGVLMTKQLMVVDVRDRRLVGTLPLRRPLCVSPSIPLVHLVNLFQTGGNALKGGHLALVCACPQIGNRSLEQGDALPETAGLMGVITLEDVLETLLQEEIYDEMDKKERQAALLASKVIRRWRDFVKRKKVGSQNGDRSEPGLVHVVQLAVQSDKAHMGEETPLLV